MKVPQNRFLIIAPSGNHSMIFKTHWMREPEKRQFDVCLLHYHKDIDDTVKYESVDYFYHLKDFKYPMIHKLLTRENPQLLEDYDYFFLIDDDIEISTEEINRAFLLTAGFSLELTQPSLTHDSYCSWPILKSMKGSYLRYFGEVEVMAPIFSQDALRKCLHTFIENKSSWGMDTLWSYILGFPKDKIAVIDGVQMKHINPVGQGELYEKLQNTHTGEWIEIQEKYGIKRHYFYEYGRLGIVNNKNLALLFSWNKIKESKRYLVQSIRDLGYDKTIPKRLFGSKQ